MHPLGYRAGTISSCLQVEYVSKKELYAISPNKNAIRAGSTHDPDRRKYGYQSDGYVGTMYCAKVTNMEKEEDKLLRSKDFKCNIHKKSNAQPNEGYVYVIQGKCNC